MMAVPTFPTFMQFPRGGAQQVLDRVKRAGMMSPLGGAAVLDGALGQSDVQAATTLGLKPNLVAWWELNETSDGSAPVARQDSHVNVRHLADNGTVTSAGGVAGVGTAAAFVTANSEFLSYATPAHLVQAGAYSFDTWVYFPSALNANVYGVGHLLTNGAGAVGNFALGISNAGFNHILWVGAWRSFAHSIALSAAVWHHLTLVWDGSTHKMYLNGLEKTLTAGALAGSGWGTGFALGRRYNAGDYATSRMAKAGLFNIALSESQIVSLHNNGAGRTYAEL